MSHFAGKALSLWTPDDVVAMLESLSLGQLGPTFKHNGVTGPDLLSLTSEELVGSFGCTPFQAKKIMGEVQRLAFGGGSPFDAPASAPPMGYPPPPAATRSAPGMGAHPAQPYSSQPMQYGSQLMQYSSQPMQYGSQPMAVPEPMAPQSMTPPYGGSQPGTPPGGSVELEKLRQELEREKLKNDLRQEISTQTRLAAVEAKGSGGVVVQQTTVQAPPPPAYAAPVYVGRERYCGPISLIIGIFLFPCICFCPIDERQVAAPAVMVPARTW